jgi:hypothetical protein
MAKKIVNKNLLLKNDELIKHKVRADPDDEDAIFEVWIKEISFLDIQNAAQRMFVVKDGDVSMSLSGYWEFAFSNWIVKTNPSLSKEELLSLKGYVGEQISKVLPQPNDLAEVLQGGFTKQGS